MPVFAPVSVRLGAERKTPHRQEPEELLFDTRNFTLIATAFWMVTGLPGPTYPVAPWSVICWMVTTPPALVPPVPTPWVVVVPEAPEPPKPPVSPPLRHPPMPEPSTRAQVSPVVPR